MKTYTILTAAGKAVETIQTHNQVVCFAKAAKAIGTTYNYTVMQERIAHSAKIQLNKFL